MSKFKANKIITKANVYAALNRIPKKMRRSFSLIDVAIVGGKLGGSEGPRRVRLWVMLSKKPFRRADGVAVDWAEYFQTMVAALTKIPLDRIEPVAVVDWNSKIAAREK